MTKYLITDKLAVFLSTNLQYYREDISLMRGTSIFEKPSYREIRPMRGRLMRGLPVAISSYFFFKKNPSNLKPKVVTIFVNPSIQAPLLPTIIYQGPFRFLFS